MSCSKSSGDRAATSSTRFTLPESCRLPSSNSTQRTNDEYTTLAVHLRGRAPVERGPGCVRSGPSGRHANVLHGRQEEESFLEIQEKTQGQRANCPHSRPHQGNSDRPPKRRLVRRRVEREVGCRDHGGDEEVSGQKRHQSDGEDRRSVAKQTRTGI